MKASDLFVKALENEGVEYIFGIPGEENLDLLESLKNSSIRLVITRHEQGAGFMAATYGRFTGKAGVCLATLGPGATNFLTPAAYAQLGAMPMLMITGQKPVKKSKQGRFQIVNVVEMMKPVTKFTRSLVSGNTIPSMVREAFRLATEERPGAVHIELPEDIAAEDCSAELVPLVRNRRPGSDSIAVERAATLLSKASRPLVLIGAGANRKRTSDALTRFVEKTGIPFFNTQMGKGVLDERHEKFLGTAALSDGDYLHCAIERADLILNIGHDVIEKPPFFMKPGGRTVIHVNFFPSEVDEVYFPQLDVVGDIARSVDALTTELEQSGSWDFSYFERVRDEMEKHIRGGEDDTRFPVIPQRLVKQVRDVLPDDGIIALDNGMYKIWFARNYKAYGPNTVLLDNALATMGAGLPSAMMASLLYPDRKVIAVVGDGGFLMNSQELETAVRLKLNLTVLILNDSSYGMIRWKQEGAGFQDWGLEFGNPDFVKYAEAYGVDGRRADSDSSLQQHLTECLSEPGIHVLDVPVDYSENARVLLQELKQKTCIL